jgi:hypothetical protein
MRGVLRLLLVVCGVLGAGATVAWATGLVGVSFVGSDGSITACVQQANGNVRLIDPSSAKKDLNSCKNTEAEVTFNQKGQKGATGARGPTGPQGMSPGPASVTVDCSAGQSINQALTDTADATSVQITVKGTCTESVGIFRDNVTLQGASSGGGIVSTSGNLPALTVGGRGVSVQGLTLGGTDGSGGLGAVSGATVQMQDMHVTGGGVGAVENSSVSLTNVTVDQCGGGVTAMGGATVFIDGGSITGCGIKASSGGSVFLRDGVSVASAPFGGVDARNGGSVVVDSATISNNGNWGVIADGGGSVILEGPDTLVTGNTGFAGVSVVNGGTVDVSDGARISGNVVGVSAGSGGHVSISRGAIVEHSTGAGIRLVGASTLSMDGQASVSDNGGDGVSLSDTSVAQFVDAIVTGNAGYGIRCDGPPSVAVIRGPTDGVTGNAAGQVACQNAGQPG